MFEIFDSYDATKVNVSLMFDDELRPLVLMRAVNTTFFELETATTFDHETAPEECFHIAMSDNGSPALNSTHQVCLKILHINEPPVFPNNSATSATIAENIINATWLVDFAAVDQDHNQSLTYSVSGGAAFTMRNNSLYAVNPLNFERQQQHKLTVLVVDDGFPFLSATHEIVVNVTDVNDAPSLDLSCTQDNCSVVHPNSLVDEVERSVAQLVVLDEDANQTHAVVLVSTTPILNLTLNGSLVLSVNGSFPTNLSSFDVTFNVTDSGEPSITVVQTLVFEVRSNRRDVSMSRAEVAGLATGSTFLVVILIAASIVIYKKSANQRSRRKTSPDITEVISFETAQAEYLDVDAVDPIYKPDDEVPVEVVEETKTSRGGIVQELVHHFDAHE
jgi:hypothetical protein